MRKSLHTRWVWLVLLLLFTTWLGVRGLNLDAINYDEHWTIRIIGAEPYGPATLPAVIANATEDPWQPPLYYLLLWLWSQLAGATPFALRFLTTLVGLLSVASAYQLGKNIFGEFSRKPVKVGDHMGSPLQRTDISAGLYAAILLGGSSLLAIYLHELRPYALYILFTILALWAYWRSVHAAKLGWRGGTFLFLSLAGLIYSHYFSIVVIVAVGLYHLLFVPKNRRWW
ncbi:MAG: glycosyltransferase family 39 protein, partial [Anaerolineae bacterium]|nr:glycosyltransferase family 39 protein [Anaerolineae bacterium]